MVSTLNKALSELYVWCIANQLTPHPQKSEVMLLSRQRIIGPPAPVFLGEQMIKWVKKTKLLGMVIDENLSSNEHISELKLNYFNKLNLVKTSRFLPTSVLLDLYTLKSFFHPLPTHWLSGVDVVTRKTSSLAL